MGYQVLALKWRPKNFSEVVGQTHVLQGLINALDNNRLHHAYLFTGTRGVGKTTLGRIFAKSLNCEAGLSASPCGVCSACIEIDEGRFVDLIEVDAASRTKVDETRELLENVQYAPSRGRFKVYLIDEVHMLTTHSFNALLKTLEEPPPHVKFILATTDPQKLPVTILSRCLKFNLKTIPQDLIVGHMTYVLEQEKLESENAALKLISRSARGSMRDALSLLDQAIAHGNGHVLTSVVREMLGTIDNKDVTGIIQALIDNDAPELLQQVDKLASHGVVFSTVLAELVSVFHSLAIAQIVPEAIDEDSHHLLEIAKTMTAEDIQLYYQIALIGQKDLPLAPDPRAGFEMILLRMYAFEPDFVDSEQKSPVKANQDMPANTNASVSSIAQRPPASVSKAVDKPIQTAANNPRLAAMEMLRGKKAEPASSEESTAPGSQGALTPTSNPATEPDSTAIFDTDLSAAAPTSPAGGLSWEDVVNQLPLSGLPRQLASHCVFVSKEGKQVKLMLSPTHAHLGVEKIHERMQQALGQFYSEDIVVTLIAGEAEADTPAISQEKQQKQNLSDAVQAMEADPNVIAMQEVLNAKLDTESVKLLDKN